MRFMHPTLQLLAMCSSALASPCKPSASTAASALTTSTEGPSTTISESATTTEFTSETFTSTTSAEPSTSTAKLPQQPISLLRNSGFEGDTVAPWVRTGYYGDPTLSTSEAHEGRHSGYISAALGGPGDIGFRQAIDASLLQADKPYKFSIYVKTTLASSCFSRFVSCDSGNGYFNNANIPESLNEWVLATVTCSWSQAQLGNGASVAVRGTCQRLSFYIDDAVLLAAE
ncbi:hypothetical protein ACHAPU_004821 [Fusarium lateritium]